VASRNSRIIPLYNLHTHSHNLLSNSIHDAGTDEKIAKFHKNGIEIVNVGTFAPVEVWSVGPSSLDSEEAPSTTRGPNFLDIPSSMVSNMIEEPVNEPAPSRSLFGKLFHPKSSSSHTQNAENATLPASSSTSDFHPEFALAPILGTTPTLFSKTVPPQGRAMAHAWICKKWCKEGDDNWVTQALNLAGHNKCTVDIRIEWSRANKRDIDPPSRKPSSHSLRTDVASDADVPPVPSLPSSPAGSDEARGRPALNLTIPGSPLFARRKASNPSIGRVSDVEEDSDPEDSEVPWICTVAVRATKDIAPGKTASQAPPVKIKVASLAPAPHHPKVVAQLKMQYPLPDVDIYEGVMLKREGLPGALDSQPEGKLILTAEEIKDIVCATSMWVVVREGFSGLSKKCKQR
jgi:hypothetical protein